VANDADLFAQNKFGDAESSPQSPQGENAPSSEDRMLEARRVALTLLEHVLGQKQQLDASIEKSAGFAMLDSRDKAFVRMVVGTTLRRLGEIDDLIGKCEERPGSVAGNLSLQNILRMGIVQIIYMDVPDHAAVDTSVRLAEDARMSGKKGFVNGVLRSIIRDYPAMMSRQDPARLNTPEWLLKTWIADYGLRVAADIATANLSEAPLDISLKDQSTLIHWAERLEARALPSGSLRRTSGGGNITGLPGFHEGLWWVQDASAAIPAQLFGDVEGKTVVDLCAAPGGKTAQLAAMGAHVLAVDRSTQRMKRLRENMQRLELEGRVEVHISDGAVWRPKSPVPFVLCDAPCSATGTIRRHPDVPHLKTPRDIDILIEVQQRILRNAFAMLEVGGILIYCTCSLQKSEGEAQIERFISENNNAIRAPINADEIGGMKECVTEQGDLRILPFMQSAYGGMDGFFVARLKKIGP
jgi:16S rRNA (cytosine967-C5)-methyltransferase